MKKENESLIDKYKRALAETENMRKRSERLVEEAKTFAIQGFCKDLLEVILVRVLVFSPRKFCETMQGRNETFYT